MIRPIAARAPSSTRKSDSRSCHAGARSPPPMHRPGSPPRRSSASARAARFACADGGATVTTEQKTVRITCPDQSSRRQAIMSITETSGHQPRWLRGTLSVTGPGTSDGRRRTLTCVVFRLSICATTVRPPDPRCGARRNTLGYPRLSDHRNILGRHCRKC
jgi:hypothetical protein